MVRKKVSFYDQVANESMHDGDEAFDDALQGYDGINEGISNGNITNTATTNVTNKNQQETEELGDFFVRTRAVG